MNPKEAETVQALKHKAPTSVREVRKLMGFLSYYRSYIPETDASLRQTQICDVFQTSAALAYVHVETPFQL